MVRRNLPPAAGHSGGRGISVMVNSVSGAGSTLSLTTSLVEQNHDIGVYVSGSDGTVEATIVRGTLPDASDQTGGRGMSVQDDPDTGAPATLTLRASVLEQNHDLGLYVRGSAATVDASVVQATALRASDQRFGRGIHAEDSPISGARAVLVVRNSIVNENRELALVAVGTDATVDGSVIANTLPNGLGAFGDAVAAVNYYQPAVLSIGFTRIESSARAAVGNFGSFVSLGSTTMQCQSFDLEGEPLNGGAFTFEDRGENRCGCPAADGVCLAVSVGLEAPEPPESIE
ncbi:MAG: hypothetical protein JRI68_10030 [Deltaproteobacteria bacterium]|nr:hypothetical protein [Deltaproteobacteria bacterium]